MNTDPAPRLPMTTDRTPPPAPNTAKKEEESNEEVGLGSVCIGAAARRGSVFICVRQCARDKSG